LKLAKQVGAAFMLLCCAAACWPQTKPCVDLTLKPTEPASHKVRSGITETADLMVGIRPSGTVDSTETICPLTNSEKFHVFLHDSYSPFNAVAAAFSAGISQASQGRRGYGQGWDAYGSRFGAAFADGESSDFFQSFLFPSLFHQDSRYFRMREGPVMRRSFYALTRVFVTHNDSGRHQFNFSEVIGGFAAAGLSDAYYPADQRDAGDVLVRAGLGIVSDAGWNLLKEFGPDIAGKLHRKHKDDAAKKDAGHYENVPRP
jgi:hypothetical protein